MNEKTVEAVMPLCFRPTKLHLTISKADKNGQEKFIFALFQFL